MLSTQSLKADALNAGPATGSGAAHPGISTRDSHAELICAERARLETLYSYGILDTLPEPQFDRIVRLAARHFDMPMALTTLIDADRQWFKARVGSELLETPLNESFCNVAIRQPNGMVIEDATLDERVSAFPSVTGEPHLRFYAGAPLITGSGHALGTLCVLDHRPRTFTAEDLGALEDFAALVMDEIELRMAVQNLGQMALKDALTGLPNRTHFRQRLTHALRRAETTGNRVILGVMDLNRFKLINDTLGHAAGDELLRQTSVRLREALASSDLVARMSGDEFTLLLEDVHTRGNAEKIMHRLEREFSRPFTLENQEVYVHWSAGLSVYPDDGHDPDTLLAQADQAMYQAKRAGRSYSFWQDETPTAAPQLNTAEQSDVARTSALHRAIERRELQLHYQPIVQADNRALVGHEALLRWRRPEGMVPPLNFIPLAESTGLIIPIGQWVLAAATEGLRSGALRRVSVNVSATEFNQPNFVRNIEHLLDLGGVDPHRLVLELTESTLLDIDRSRQVLKRLRTLGVRLALDDFGTGYSSMSSLLKLPLSVLKIDQSFTAEIGQPGDAGHRALEIARAIVTLAGAYNLDTVAEGIETAEQATLLTEIGCNMLQGFYFGQPAPIQEHQTGH